MLSLEQEKAVKILKTRFYNKENISVFQGPSGSGKTFTLKHLIESLGLEEKRIHFATFTGTAAKVLMKTGVQASTIHKLIYNPIIQNGVCIGFRKKMEEELAHLKLIVIDEFSMLSNELLYDLMSYHIPIILVGDKFQLPPIGEPNDFINQIDAELTEPQRQALESPILWAANQIRLGLPLLNGTYGDILLVDRKDKLSEDWKRKDVQFLCGLNATRNKLNLEIGGSVNPFIGASIIFLKNDWDRGIVNGTIGEIKRIRNQYSYYIISFVEDDIWHNNYYVTWQELPKRMGLIKNTIDFSYCLTVNKAQGQTIDSPMCIIDESYYWKEYRNNWLYTAISRSSGKNKVALLR